MIEIACAADRAFLPHAATMLCSALEHAGEGSRVHVLLGENVAEADALALAEMIGERGGTARLHPMADEEFAGLKAAGPFPTSVWYRAALPDLLADADRVLYLDSDLLVYDSLQPLWEIELGEDLLGAVTNVIPDRAFAVAHCQALGLDPARYFNSGVLLLDLAGLRAIGSFGLIRDFAESNRERLIFPDQDALNGALGDRRLALHPRWNLLLGIELAPWSDEVHRRESIAEAIARPAIRHFEGGANKPWTPGAPEAVRRLWESYRDLTPWARTGQRA